MLTTDLAAGRLESSIARATHDLESVQRLLRAAVRHLDDAEPGYPGGGTAGGYVSPDGPLRQSVIVRDDALRDRAQLEQLAANVEAHARGLLNLCYRWGITRHGNQEGVDERSTVCDWCANPREVKTRRLCNWCTNTFGAVNAERRSIGRQPANRLPAAALEHRRNGRANRVTPADIARWARNGGK